MSWHGALHEVGFALSTLGWLLGCGVLLRGFIKDSRRGWTVASTAAMIAALAVGLWPTVDGLSLRLMGLAAIEFAYIAALAVAGLRLRSAADATG